MEIDAMYHVELRQLSEKGMVGEFKKTQSPGFLFRLHVSGEVFPLAAGDDNVSHLLFGKLKEQHLKKKKKLELFSDHVIWHWNNDTLLQVQQHYHSSAVKWLKSVVQDKARAESYKCNQEPIWQGADRKKIMKLDYIILMWADKRVRDKNKWKFSWVRGTQINANEPMQRLLF